MQDLEFSILVGKKGIHGQYRIKGLGDKGIQYIRIKLEYIPLFLTKNSLKPQTPNPEPASREFRVLGFGCMRLAGILGLDVWIGVNMWTSAYTWEQWLWGGFCCFMSGKCTGKLCLGTFCPPKHEP